MTVHHHRHPAGRTAGRAIAATAAAAFLGGLLVVPAAAGATGAPDDGDTLEGLGVSASLPADEIVAPALLDAEGSLSVFVEIAGDSALEVQKKNDSRTKRAANAAVDERVKEIKTTTQQIAEEVQADDAEAKPLYVTSYTVPGIAVNGDAKALRALTEREDVVRITPIVTRTSEDPQAADPANGGSDALTRSIQAWTQTGETGAGVNVAVIDTGIDYTHADFGGAGTPAAYTTALAATTAPNLSWYDSAKYKGGWDFAGTSYDANSSSTAYNPFPAPDANPIDGRGGNHGTHVSGTAAGYGVTTSGEPFSGDYTTLTEQDVQSMSIGPGSAPEAGLFALKVFGDGGGSTDLAGAAIDWVGAAVADGVDIDVVNLSLGSNYGAADDPDNAKLAALMDHGVLPVVAAGNSGDITDVAGSPGNTGRTLAVAASSSGRGLLDGVEVSAPAELATGTYAGQYSQNYWTTENVTGTVVKPTDPANMDGCTAFSTEQRTLLRGKIAWLDWDDADVACGSATRFDNAQNAGAIAVVLPSERGLFEAGIAGNLWVPGVQLDGPSTDALEPAAEAGTLVLSLRGELQATVPRADGDLEDTLASFTSRGVHGSIDDVVKPDVSAPGVNILSAGSGKGTGAAVMSGTSMATPLTAGVAALVSGAHPAWSADRVKAALMNTAVHDITTTGDEPLAYGPLRAGTGRIDALAAVRNSVSVTSDENPGLVTGSFGVVEVGDEGLEATRTFTVSNESDEEQTYTLEYLERTAMPGVSYTLSADSVTVTAGGSTSFTVTLSVEDPAALRRAIDPTMSAEQGGLLRTYVADASGVVQLTSTTGSDPLRVAVFSAPEPVSDVQADDVVFTGDAGASTLTLTGSGVDQGEGSERFRSLVAPFALGTTDPAEEFSEGLATDSLSSVDLRQVGASSTAPQLADPSQGILSFGLVMDGDWARVSPFSYPLVEIDVNGDSRYDFRVYTTVWSSTVDLGVAVTEDLTTGAVVDVRPLNGLDGDVDTNLYDSNVMVLPVSLEALGYTPDTTATEITYRVGTFSYYAPREDEFAPAVGMVDLTDPVSFDVYSPDLWVGETGQQGSGDVYFADAAGDLPVHRAADAEATSQLLLLHMHNGAGRRSEVVSWSQAAPGVALTDVEARAACVRGKVQLGVSAVNAEAATVAMVLSSDFGEETFAKVKAGRTVKYSFSTRLSQVAAGTATVTAWYVDAAGVRHEQSYEASYDAADCRR